MLSKKRVLLRPWQGETAEAPPSRGLCWLPGMEPVCFKVRVCELVEQLCVKNVPGDGFHLQCMSGIRSKCRKKVQCKPDKENESWAAAIRPPGPKPIASLGTVSPNVT